MSRNYVKVEALAADVFRRKAAGENNRQIAESYGLTIRQIEQLVNRQNRKKRKLEAATQRKTQKGFINSRSTQEQ